MATAKPSRTRKQPSAKTPSKAQVRRQKDKVAEEKTQQMADAAYRRAYRHTQVSLARLQAKQQAMADAGIKQQQPPAAPQQQPTSQKKAPPKPAAKAPKSGRKPPRRR